VDFLEPGAEKWVRLIMSYLSTVCPGLRQLWGMGLVGWMANPYMPSLPRFMTLAFIFEALYRITVHLLGVEILQRSRPAGGGCLKTHYKMLDSRLTGICSAGVLDRIVSHLPCASQQTAKHLLGLAIKARNSVAHGAVVSFDDYTADGLGNILAKAVQTLVTAGLHHLISERAYYRWKCMLGKEETSALSDWLEAEKETIGAMYQMTGG
jgi:hypothetical protein